MWVFRITCITIVSFVSLVVAGTSELELQSRGPRDCTEVYLGEDSVEGYYVVFPNENKSDKGALIHCGVDDGMLPRNSSVPKSSPHNCQDLKDGGMSNSGLNVIYPYVNHPETPIMVYCDQELMGGGWTVFQRRDDYDTQLDFYRSFDEYALGFGNPGGEYWMGLDILHELTQQSVNELYVGLTSFNDVNKYANYKTFNVGPREPTAIDMSDKPYYMSVSHYSGDAGDSLTYHSGMAFSAKDADHDYSDGDCAKAWKSGWWYNTCHSCHLNGVYYDDGEARTDSVNWYTFSNSRESLRRVVMQVRPLKQQ